MTLRKLTPNYSIYAASGADSNVTAINKFGRNSAVANGGTEEIWDGSAAYVWPTTAVITKVSQTSDQAAMQGELVEVQGLDANWNEVTQNVTLNASDTTTPVTLSTALIRIFRMRVLANVVIDSTIRAHNTAESQDYAVISVGENQTQMAIYTIPADKVGYVTNYYAHHNPVTGQQFTSNPIRLWARDNANSYEKQLKHVVGIAEDGFFQHTFNPYIKFTEKTDIFITSSPVSGAADISAGFDLILTND